MGGKLQAGQVRLMLVEFGHSRVFGRYICAIRSRHVWLSCKEKGLDIQILTDSTKIARVVRHGWKSLLSRLKKCASITHMVMKRSHSSRTHTAYEHEPCLACSLFLVVVMGSASSASAGGSPFRRLAKERTRGNASSDRNQL